MLKFGTPGTCINAPSKNMRTTLLRTPSAPPYTAQQPLLQRRPLKDKSPPSWEKPFHSVLRFPVSCMAVHKQKGKWRLAYGDIRGKVRFQANMNILIPADIAVSILPVLPRYRKDSLPVPMDGSRQHTFSSSRNCKNLPMEAQCPTSVTSYSGHF